MIRGEREPLCRVALADAPPLPTLDGTAPGGQPFVVHAEQAGDLLEAIPFRRGAAGGFPLAARAACDAQQLGQPRLRHADAFPCLLDTCADCHGGEV